MVRRKRHDEIVQLHKRGSPHEASPPPKLRLIRDFIAFDFRYYNMLRGAVRGFGLERHTDFNGLDTLKGGSIDGLYAVSP